MEMSGLGTLDRRRLTEILRGTKGTISVQEAAAILNLSAAFTAKLLARWARKGWLTRIKQGIYVPVQIESLTSDIALEEPWIIAAHLADPCYIGGWSAAEHWGLTEQIYRTVLVMTKRKLRDRRPVIQGTPFRFVTISESALFGTRSVWKGEVKIAVSDPSKTLVDMLNNPELGGGIRPAVDVLQNYLSSDAKDIDLLMEYCTRLGNGAVFKRLGFLLERVLPENTAAIQTCRENLTQGYADLDPHLPRKRLITRWRLWLPEGWA